MDIQRAKEIVHSPEMLNVTYEGKQIYIKQVNDDNKTARIYPLDLPDDEKNVNVASLTEH